MTTKNTEKGRLVGGKFKTIEALTRAYENLEKEFTRRSQRLKEAENLLKEADAERAEIEEAKAAPKTEFEEGSQEAIEMKASEKTAQEEELAKSHENASKAVEELVEEKDAELAGSGENEVQNATKKEDVENQKTLENSLELKNSADKLDAVSKIENDESLKPAYERENWKEAVERFFEAFPDAKEFAKDISKLILERRETACAEDCLKDAYFAALRKNRKAIGELAGDEEFLKEHILSNEGIRKKIIDEFLLSVEAGQPPALMSKGGTQALSAPKKPKTLKEAGQLFTGEI